MTKNDTRFQLSEKELKALNHIAGIWGRAWKAKLIKLWRENAFRVEPEYQAELRSIRNGGGESWLKSMSLKGENAKAEKTKRPLVVTFQVTCEGDAFVANGVGELAHLFNHIRNRVLSFDTIEEFSRNGNVKLRDSNGNTCAILSVERQKDGC